MFDAPATTRTTKHSGERSDYTFGLLDAEAKKEVRRACLKAVAIPGYQVPFASREMPIARGFGTGGLQITLSLLGVGDVVKVIDQGSDDSINACNIRRLISGVCPGVRHTWRTARATIIQTRHRIPERPLSESQVFVLQVPYPDPLTLVEPSEARRAEMHGEGDYSRLYVKLYEDLARHDQITISHRYPTRVHGHYTIDPTPIPRWDVPKLHRSPCVMLFGAGREHKIYAIPPYTVAEPLAFEDRPFEVESFFDEDGAVARCHRCGATDTYLDECFGPGNLRVYACSDTENCDLRLHGERERDEVW